MAWIESDGGGAVVKDIPRWLLGSLQHGEAVQWIGRPDTGLVIRFTTLWRGGLMMFAGIVIGSGLSGHFGLGIPYVLAGLGAMGGLAVTLSGLFGDSRRRARTRYVVTRQRLMIFTPGEMWPITRNPPPAVRTEAHGDGTCSLYFTDAPTGRLLQGRAAVKAAIGAVGLFGLTDSRGDVQVELGEAPPDFVFERLNDPRPVLAILQHNPDAPRGVLPGEARWRR